MESLVQTNVAMTLALAFSSFLPAEGIQRRPHELRRKPSLKIAGGVEAPLGSVPYQVVLTTENEYFCSGSIIDRDFIITAGQCCTGIPPTGVMAGVNDLANPEDGAQEVEVGQIVPHPNYTTGKHINDICILHLKQSLTLGNATRTAIIKLPPVDHVAKGNANVSGWGFTLDGYPSKLMIAEVPIRNDNECQQYSGSTMVESIVCAGGKGKGACLGDTGGPLVDSERYLVGVASRGNACSNTGYVDIYMEVSYFVGWIKEIMSHVRKAGKSTYNWSPKVGSAMEHP